MNKLPEYVLNKPEAVQAKWSNIYNNYAQDSEAVAYGVANKWLASQKEEAVVMRDVDFVVEEEQIIQRSIGGVEYTDFLLADNRYDSWGTKYSESFLEKLSSYINTNQDKLNDDFNHEELYKMQKEGRSKEYIKEHLPKMKKGIMQIIKAIYENGKLYIRTLVNPKYKERVMKAKGVSIEGSFAKDGDTFFDGKILGVSVIDRKDKDLGNPRAKRL